MIPLLAITSAFVPSPPLPTSTARRSTAIVPVPSRYGTFVDYYEVLGISSKASQSEIKLRFWAHAKKLHPDVNDAPDAAEAYMRVAKAYAVLKDPRLRAKHDTERWAEQMARLANMFVDRVVVPFVRDKAVPFARDKAAPAVATAVGVAAGAAKRTASKLRQEPSAAVAAATGFVVAGPVGAVGAIAAERALNSDVGESPGPAVAAAAGFVVAGPVGAVGAVAAERALAAAQKDDAVDASAMIPEVSSPEKITTSDVTEVETNLYVEEDLQPPPVSSRSRRTAALAAKQ